MTRRNRHAPIPLTRWIHGRVHVHFRSGHVAELRVSLHGAHSVRLQVEEKQGGESIDGLRSHEGWIAMRDEEVVLTEWTPDPDYGWGDTSPEHRDRLRSLGMDHGILCALADLWEDRSVSPTYSIAAMSTLFSLATSRAAMTRGEWGRVARLVEGADGAKVVASVWDEDSRPDVPSHLVKDEAEAAAAAGADANPTDAADPDAASPPGADVDEAADVRDRAADESED